MRKLPPELVTSIAIQTRILLRPSPSPPAPLPQCRLLYGHGSSQPWLLHKPLCRIPRRLYSSSSSSTSTPADTTPSPPPPPSSSPSSAPSPSPSSQESHSQPSPPQPKQPPLPFRFQTGLALFAKRTPRPFPPPFLSPPSGSFSDPLSTHDRSRSRLSTGEVIRGLTNGDDAVYASPHLIVANDGVGAWSTRPRGHAGLWARLVAHFWAGEVEGEVGRGGKGEPDVRGCLQRAYERTVEATGGPGEWLGTTTVCGALLWYREGDGGMDGKRTVSEEEDSRQGDTGDMTRGETPDTSKMAQGETTRTPLLYVTNLGDSQVMVIRPSTSTCIFKTTEQWHWFDCPRQLGTNSPDTPESNAVVDVVGIEEGDVVLAMSDGVIDNLWEHEIVSCVSESVADWDRRRGGWRDGEGMQFVAQELVERAKKIALDPFAESPFMEHAVEEGLPSEGGKLDDISVVAALCTRNDEP